MSEIRGQQKFTLAARHHHDCSFRSDTLLVLQMFASWLVIVAISWRLI